MRERWLSKRAISLHVLLAICVPGCLIAGWWQVHVALAGNSLGWVYSVEWPFFACFGTYVWWNLIHDNTDAVGTRALIEAGRRLAGRSGADLPVEASDELRQQIAAEDPDMAAYNAYLASLAAQGPKSWRRQ